MNSSTLKTWLGSMMLVAIVAACGGSTTPTAAPASPADSPAASPSVAPSETAATPSAASSAQPSAGKLTLKAYFLLFGNTDGPTPLVPVSREVDGTVAVARAAMEQVLAGPTDDERAHDLRVGTIGTRIPEGTRLLSIDVADGIATVDLSGEFATGDITGDERESWAIRLAQVTYTLTQFPTVESVRFLVDGKPGGAIEGHEGTPIDLATRGAYADQLGGIFVDEPAWGGALSDPLTVSGIAQIDGVSPEFQAVIVSRTTDEPLARQTVRPACPEGCWQPPGGGPFEFEIAIPGGADQDDLMLVVWSGPANDDPSNAVSYPLR
jgi:germination protein M